MGVGGGIGVLAGTGVTTTGDTLIRVGNKVGTGTVSVESRRTWDTAVVGDEGGGGGVETAVGRAISKPIPIKNKSPAAPNKTHIQIRTVMFTAFLLITLPF